MSDPAVDEASPPRARAWLLALAPYALVAVAYASTLRFSLFGDARFLIEHNRFMAGWSYLWPNLTHDYFWCSDGVSIPYWRPLTKASWLVEHQLFGADPAGYHAVQLAWFVAALAGVQALARRLGATPAAAAFAVLLAGLHPAAIEPVSLVMARSDVVAAAGLAWTFVAWHAWVTTGRARWGVAHAAALLVALGSKEVGVVALPVLAAWTWLLRREDPPRPVGLARLAPAAALVALYLLARRVVLRDEHPAGPTLDPLRVVVGGGRYLLALLPLRFESGVTNLSRAWAATPAMIAAGVAAWAAGAGAVLVAWRRRRRAVVLAAWALASLAPVLLVAQIQVPGVAGKLALADRWVLQAVMASAVGWALAVDALRPRLRAGVMALGLAWAVAACAIAAPTRAYYATEVAYTALEDETYAATPEAYRTREDDCRYYGRRVTAAMSHDRMALAVRLGEYAQPRCADDPLLRLNLFAARVRLGRDDEARPALVGLLIEPSYTRPERALLLLLAAELRTRDGAYTEADRLLRESAGLGMDPCRLFGPAAAVARGLGDVAREAAMRARAARCAAGR